MYVRMPELASKEKKKGEGERKGKDEKRGREG